MGKIVSVMIALSFFCTLFLGNVVYSSDLSSCALKVKGEDVYSFSQGQEDICSEKNNFEMKVISYKSSTDRVEKASLDIYSNVLIENETSFGDDKVFAEIFKGDVLIKEISLKNNFVNVIQNLTVGTYKIVYSSLDEEYEINLEEQEINVQADKLNRVEITAALKNSNSNKNEDSKKPGSFVISSSNSTLSMLNENRMPLDNSIDLSGVRAIKSSYFFVGIFAASLGLFLSVFSLNPDINIFKKYFKFISKKLGAK